MRFAEGELYYVHNRGNNQQTVFFSEDHFLIFLQKLRSEIAPNCDILGWCLIPNEFHVLVRANADSCILMNSYGGKPMQRLANKIGICLSSYTQKINAELNRSGSLFQQKTKAQPLPELMLRSKTDKEKGQFLEELLAYLHAIPLKAGLVARMDEWRFSSFLDLSGLRKGTLCKTDIITTFFEYDAASFCERSYAVLATKLLH